MTFSNGPCNGILVALRVFDNFICFDKLFAKHVAKTGDLSISQQ